MRKHIIITLLIGFAMVACKQNDKETELKLKEMEYELAKLKHQEGEKTKSEQPSSVQAEQTNPTQSSGSLDSEVPYSYAYITSSNVIFRSSHSTNSASLGKFKTNERVEIIDEYNPDNSNEAITRRTVQLYDDNGRTVYKLNPGKAVQIVDEYDVSYRVSFKDSRYGKLYAEVNADDLEFISGDKWYKVRRTDGRIGWVFSKFVSR